MKVILNLALVALGLLHPPISHAQQLPSPDILSDTTLAQKYFNRGKELETSANYDSANFHFETSRLIYEKMLARQDDARIRAKYLRCYNDVGFNLVRRENMPMPLLI